ncbi:TIC20-V [Symbiodinium microadriaticum]|nr:TIC20-V [Symbiodinium microadriaticum]
MEAAPPRPLLRRAAGSKRAIFGHAQSLRVTPAPASVGRRGFHAPFSRPHALALALALPRRRRTPCRSCSSGSDTTNLLSWLQEFPNARGLDGLMIRQSAYAGGGLGVFATRSFSPGELVCRIPADALILPGDLASRDMDLALAETLLSELSAGADSEFAPYIQSLPGGKDLAPLHPLSWPSELQGEAYVAELMRGTLNGCCTLSARLSQGLALAHGLAARGFSNSQVLWALTAVDSRSFNLRAGPGGAVRAMVPLIDLLNTFVPVASGPACWNCQFSGDVDSGAELKAVSQIQPGDELTHLYSELSSAALWASYGFVPDEPMENPHEAALIDVPLEEEAVSSHKDLLGSLAPRHWRDEKTLLFEVPWDAEEETGPVYATLFALLGRGAESAELAGNGAIPARLRLAAAEVLRQRIQDALQKNLESERELSGKDVAGRKHADFEGKLQAAAIRLLRNERPLLEDELAFTEDQCLSFAAELEEEPS